MNTIFSHARPARVASTRGMVAHKEYTMLSDKRVIVVRDLGMFEEEEVVFSSDTLPMAKHYACRWAKSNGYKLIKSPAKIAKMFSPYRTPCNKNEVIWYAV